MKARQRSPRLDVKLVARVVGEIRPLLAGKPPEVQGAVLADLTAMWIAGHRSPGDREMQFAMREALLELHMEGVRDLILHADREIDAKLK